MSAKANPTRIGMFVVGAIVLLVASIVVFGGGKFFEKKAPFVAFFEGSLSGLSVGAPVTYRGVPIGEVTNIKVSLFTETLVARVPIHFNIVPDRLEVIGEKIGTPAERIQKLIEHGLRAELVSQSLVTGQLAIELNIHPGTPIRLIGAEPGVIEIPTVPSAIQEMMGELQKLQLDQLIASAEKLINNVDALINTPEAKALMPEILKVVDDAGRLIVALDAEVVPTLKSFRDAADAGTTAMVHFDKEMGPIMADIRRVVSEINGSLPKTMQSLDAVLLSAGDAVKPNSASMRDLQRALKEFAAASYAVRALAEELRRNPSSVIRGR